MSAAVVVLMGVAGAGKTTVGRLLAKDLGWPFLEADDFHPARNVDKMRRGEPLTDADREPWLASLRARIGRLVREGDSAVVACSALKQTYRDRLRIDPAVRFVFLKGGAQLLRRRLEERRDHFFPPELLLSQLEALEEPQGVVTVDVAQPPEQIVREIERELGLGRS